MKLSTAIRIGSMTTRQITHAATDGRNGRCALGAAVDATGVRVTATNWIEEAQGHFPLLIDEEGRCFSKLAWDIMNMNDSGTHTREQIADYVERYENEHDGYLQTGVTESKPLERIAMEAK